MWSVKVEDFYDVAKPLHQVSQLLGLTCFTVKQENKVFTSRITLLNFLFLIIAIARILIYAKLCYDIPWNTITVFSSEVYSKSMLVLMFGFIVVYLIVNCWMLAVKKSFSMILIKMVEVDNELSLLKVGINLKRQRNVVLLSVVLIVILTSVTTILMFLVARDQDLLNIDEFLFLSILFITTMADQLFFVQFVFLMISVKLRYRRINLYLKVNFLYLKTVNERSGNDKLTTASSLHDKLVDLSQIINKCYGFPVSKFRSCFYFLKYETSSDDAERGKQLCLSDCMHL